VQPIVPRPDRFWRVDPIAADPKAITECDRVANQKAVEKQGVRNEIQITSEVARKIGDTRFIIPLKLGNFDAPFLIAHAQYIDFSHGWSAGLYELMAVLQDEYRVPLSSEPRVEVWGALQAINGRKLELRTEHLVSNWLRVRKIPGALFYYRNSELRHQGIKLTFPRVPYGNGFLTCEEHRFQGISRTSLNYVLGNGWPELGIPATEIRKVFASLAHQGMDLLLKSRGLHSFEMASGHQAWWFAGDLPDSRLPFRWGELKGSRVLRGASTKRKMQWQLRHHITASRWPESLLSCSHTHSVLRRRKGGSAGKAHAPNAPVLHQGMAQSPLA
jgi:hypothetical protein